MSSSRLRVTSTTLSLPTVREKYNKDVKRRAKPRGWLKWLGAFAAVTLILLIRSSSSPHASDLERFLVHRRDLNNRRHLKLTNVLNHAPGFTLFENLYWRDHTFHIFTDQHSTLPPFEFVFHLDPTPFVPHGPDGELKQWTVQGDVHSPEVEPQRLPGTKISYEEALELIGGAIPLQERMFLSTDTKLLGHYYHFFAEMFLGAWKLWYNYFWKQGFSTAPAFGVISFTQMYHRHEAPAEWTDPTLPWKGTWEERFGTNRRMLDLLYPGAVLESRNDWDRRARTNSFYRLPLVLLANREAGILGPQTAHKPYGDAYRLHTPDFLHQLRTTFLPARHVRHAKKPRVMYLSRQGTWRNMSDDAHQELTAGLKAMEKEGHCTVSVETFGQHRKDFLEFQNAKEPFLPMLDQIKVMANTDIVVAVHGNGLTHAMWMEPGSTIFELQPDGCTLDDFGPAAHAAGVNHWIIHDREKCSSMECGIRGCEPGVEINQAVIHVNVEYILQEVRAELANRVRPF